MTVRQRVAEVLERWCGTDIGSTDETLQDLWNRTKPIGTPSHSAIDYFPQGASDLLDGIIAEYKRSRPEERRIRLQTPNFDPTSGTILTLDDLFVAVSQSEILEAVVGALSSDPAAGKPAGKKKAAAKKPAKKVAAKKQKPNRNRK